MAFELAVLIRITTTTTKSQTNLSKKTDYKYKCLLFPLHINSLFFSAPNEGKHGCRNILHITLSQSKFSKKG